MPTKRSKSRKGANNINKMPIQKVPSQDEINNIKQSLTNTSLSRLQTIDEDDTQLEEYQAKINESNYNSTQYFGCFKYSQFMWFLRIFFWLLVVSLFFASTRRFVAVSIKSVKKIKWTFEQKEDQYLKDCLLYLLSEGGEYLIGIFLYYSGWRVGPVWFFNFLVVDIYHYITGNEEATRIDNVYMEATLQEMKHMRVNISLTLLDLHDNDAVQEERPEINMRTLDEDRCKY